MLTDRLFAYNKDFDVELPKKLTRIWLEFDVEKLLKPTNHAELKECFMNSEGFFNPEFKYETEKIKKCRDDLRVIARGLSNILVNMETLDSQDQMRAEFVRYLVTGRLNEAISMAAFLESVLKGCPEKAMEDLSQIYDFPNRKDENHAREIANNGWGDEYCRYAVIKSSTKRKRMQERFYPDLAIAQSFQTAMMYLLKEPIMCRYFDSNDGFEAKTGAYEKIGLLFEDDKYIMAVPEGISVNGEEMLALVGSEIDGHFRTMAVAQAFISMMLGKKSPLEPLSPLLAKSLNDALCQGYARNSYAYVKGVTGFPEPFSTLAVSYALRKHNFAEVAEHVCRFCLRFGLEKEVAREKTWGATAKAFLGQTNTRKIVRYAFPKDCGELREFFHASNMAGDEYYYLRNLATLELGELQRAIVGGWLDDDDFADKINCGRVDVINYMSNFF